jgi:hypothetical protein
MEKVRFLVVGPRKTFVIYTAHSSASVDFWMCSGLREEHFMVRGV